MTVVLCGASVIRSITTQRHRDEHGGLYATAEGCENRCWSAPVKAEMIDECPHYNFFAVGDKIHESCNKEQL